MKSQQTTIAKAVAIRGVGVHTGKEQMVVLRPAEIGTGVVWRDGNNISNTIKMGAYVPHPAPHATVLRSGAFTVSTVEHLLVALWACQIDNIYLDVFGTEIPILDGSALPFVFFIQDAGLRELSAPRHVVTPRRPLFFKDEQARYLELLPARIGQNHIQFECSLQFDSIPQLSAHTLMTIAPTTFIAELAAARTFGTLSEAKMLRQHGLAQGSSLANTLVFGNHNWLNEPRMPDEHVRHKMLDFLGDLFLIGASFVGSIKVEKPGHSFNRLVVEHYVKNPDLWEFRLVTQDS